PDTAPQDALRSDGHDALSESVELVLGPRQPAVEEPQPHRDHHHEGGGSEHPGGVARRDRGVHDSSSPAPAPAPACWTCLSASRCTASAFTAVSAALSTSPVRMRMTSSIGWTQILPSPTSPVRTEPRM